MTATDRSSPFRKPSSSLKTGVGGGEVSPPPAPPVTPENLPHACLSYVNARRTVAEKDLDLCEIILTFGDGQIR